MPQAVVLDLVGPHPPLYLGKYAHGLFFSLVARLDPDLAEILHGARKKPFTLTPLQEGNNRVRLRFSSLDDKLFHTFLTSLLQIAPDGVPLGATPYRLVRVLANPQEHPLVGSATWETLRSAPPLGELTFVFHSPTVFATSKPGGRNRYTPLPEPRLIARSLLEKWQAYSPYPYGAKEEAALLNLFELDLELASFHGLQFHRVQAAKGFLPGFTGEVRLRLHSESVLVREALGRLASLAFYSGVGAKTPYGMGLVVAKLRS